MPFLRQPRSRLRRAAPGLAPFDASGYDDAGVVALVCSAHRLSLRVVFLSRLTARPVSGSTRLSRNGIRCTPASRWSTWRSALRSATSRCRRGSGHLQYLPGRESGRGRRRGQPLRAVRLQRRLLLRPRRFRLGFLTLSTARANSRGSAKARRGRRPRHVRRSLRVGCRGSVAGTSCVVAMATFSASV